jgi:EH_Signature domain
MLLSWVTRENLRIFFEILAGRNGVKKDRFEFWSQYIDQASDTKLVFGQETKLQQHKKTEIAQLFKEEEGHYALLDSSNRDLDAFIIQIKGYVFVVFSMNNNAAFIYDRNNLPFNLNARKMNDETSGNGLKSAQDNKIIQIGSWQDKTKNRLMSLGIFPDAPIRR